MSTLTETDVHAQAGTSIADANPYLVHRFTIEQAIRVVCRRHRLSPEDAEDFASEARIHLMERDFEALRRFQGRSSLSTYILSVVSHFGQDWRNARWGKWRPSAEARRRGAIATHLERLMRRDGFTFEEAYETLRMNLHVTVSRADLEAVASTLPARTRRRFVGTGSLDDRPAPGPTPYVLAECRAAAGAAHVALRLLVRAIASLTPEDVLLLKLRFEDGLRVIDIARTLQVQDKPLYRRFTRVLGQLKTELEQQGLGGDAVRDLLAGQGFSDLADGCPPLEATPPRLRANPRRVFGGFRNHGRLRPTWSQVDAVS